MDELQRLWQEQPVEPVEINLEQIQRRSAAMGRRVRWRNGVEYLAAASVVAVFIGASLTAELPWLIRASFVELAGSAVWIVLVLRLRGTYQPPPIDVDTTSHIEHYKDQIRRQSRLLHNAWLWYVMPFAIGCVMLLAGIILANPATAAEPVLWLAELVQVTVLTGVIWLNRRARDKLRRELDSLAD